tara:strand:- start:235 stop:951 length:717 start_codon:yes stop_codon:yes gene_type:complete
MKTFILHYQPLKERKEHMENEISKHNLDAEFILKFDKEDMTDDDKSIFDFESVWSNRTLWVSNASLISKHIESYRMVIENNLDFGHVLEDDVILLDGFKEKSLHYISQLPENWDILFFGDGYRGNMKVPKKVVDELGGNVFLKSLSGNGMKDREVNGWPICAGASRCSDNYVISRKCCEKILNHINFIKQGKKSRINNPSDLWMNKLFRELRLSIYWGEPTLSTQGTESGMFKSAHKK